MGRSSGFRASRASSLSLSAAAILAGVLGFGDVRDAQACGGCFHPVSQTEVEASVISDHRMVFKISTDETILWDQVRYTGSPQEFAWVLPVRSGAVIELSHDAWIAALDATTPTTVQSPPVSCSNGSAPTGGGGGGGGGCASTTEEDSAFGSARAVSVDAGVAGNSNVSVVSQSVIGPYQAVTLHSKNGLGISDWLTSNNYAIPPTVKPIVDAYTTEGFDFIALRLRPGQGVQAMQPVRVVTPGADVSLPLRMVAAGVGAHVGITLWVVTEGRYELQNFPNAIIDDSKLTWDGPSAKSNLVELQNTALASNDGHTWITEVSEPVSVSAGSFSSGGGLGLYANYVSACITRPPAIEPCNPNQLPPSDGVPPDQTQDAGSGSDASDASVGDADASIGIDASTGSSSGGSSSGGSSSGGSACTQVVSGCDGFDDLDVAARGLHDSDIWVTRLRSDLPVAALANDIKLQATAAQVSVSGTHQTTVFSDPKFDPCAATGGTNTANGASSSNNSSNNDNGGCICDTSPRRGGELGTWMIMGLTALLASKIVRRRRRRR